MGLYFGDCRETGVGFISGYFCGILPEKELRHEFNIGSNLSKDKNIEYKVREQERGMVKGLHIHSRPSTEGKMQNYRW